MLFQTAAEWEATSNFKLLPYQTSRDEFGREKTGDGETEWGDLPYDAPAGQIYQLPVGTPDANSQIGYNSVIPAVAATTTIDCGSAGTVGAQILVGSKQYTIVATGPTGDQIAAGSSGSQYAQNIADKITADTADTYCTANTNGGDPSAYLTANTAGAAGNAITVFSTDLSATTQPFVYGTDQVNAYERTSLFAAAAPPFETLEANDDGDFVWNFDGAETRNAYMSSAVSVKLILTGFAAGATGTVVIYNSGGLDITITTNDDNTVVNNGGGALVLPPGLNVASFIAMNSYVTFWTFGTQFT